MLRPTSWTTLSRSVFTSSAKPSRVCFRRQSSQAMSSQPRIAVIGGGPAGLTIGVLLHKHQIPFTVFELREKPSEGELAKPSGMLDLHEESGLAAIRECGLYDRFVPLTGECTEDFVVSDRQGKILLAESGDGDRPEISRNNLTKLLLGNIPTDSVKWGHKLLSADSLAASTGSEMELDFGSHGKHTFDLVIGADGAWSKVRSLLTDVKPHYTGMQIITITIREITRKYPHLASLIGSGSFSSLGNKHGVISQRGPFDSSRIFLWLKIPDEDFPAISGMAGKPAKNAKDKLLGDKALLGTFGPVIKELVATGCDEESLDNPGAALDIRPLYTLPHGSSWEHKTGATLVGDAAHLMLPNGEGVNAAMFDSLLLSQAIAKAYQAAGKGSVSFQTALDPLLREFEAAMVQRAEEVGGQTDGLIRMMFGSDDAAYDFVKFFQSMLQEQSEK
ncbi:salicylate hydroxylase [Thozetella sp. PMI_491]|nr:salicylate hydroxylase [Thozetella sp. PMI_491]